MRSRRRSSECLEHHESPNTPATASRTQAAATVDAAYIENLNSAPNRINKPNKPKCVAVLERLLTLLLVRSLWLSIGQPAFQSGPIKSTSLINRRSCIKVIER